MRTISFILAFACILASPSMAGYEEGRLPGVGTFAFQGAATPAETPLIIAQAH